MFTPQDIIIRPVITERAMDGLEAGKYTFVVDKRATKPQIKLAIQEIFGVKVKSVNTMNMLGKVKRQGAKVGKRADWKKAIITLTEDSKTIEFFEGI